MTHAGIANNKKRNKLRNLCFSKYFNQPKYFLLLILSPLKDIKAFWGFWGCPYIDGLKVDVNKDIMNRKWYEIKREGSFQPKLDCLSYSYEFEMEVYLIYEVDFEFLKCRCFLYFPLSFFYLQLDLTSL